MNNRYLKPERDRDDYYLRRDRKKLLIPGWAGQLTPEEFAYIKASLRESPTLKRKWGFRPSAKRLSNKHIRLVAMYGLSAIR